MTKEEIAELIQQMPQGMDANDYIYELVNRALAVKRKWVGLTEEDFYKKDDELVFVLGMKFAAARLKEKNT